MRREKGSLTVEAALIVPILLLLMALAIHTGIDLQEETKELAEKLQSREELPIVDVLYGMESFEKLFQK